MDRAGLPEVKRIHMVGVGGAGMSGLATVLTQMGYSVSGSDLQVSSVKERLSAVGVTVCEGHDARNIGNVDLVVASAAVPHDNVELAAARTKGVPIVSRAEMLGWLMAGTYSVAVTGTHGKTTTTSMLATVLECGGLDPTVLIGGDLDRLNGNARLGNGRIFLTEACEAYGSFLELNPMVAVVTNVEAEHLDYYGSLAGVMKGFEHFLSRIQDGGLAVLCVDCPNTRSLIPSVTQRVMTYGLDPHAVWRAAEVNTSSPYPSFKVMHGGLELGEVVLRVPGRHNVQNALAATAVGSELGIGFQVVQAALAQFEGACRRFQILGSAAGITVVDDYAHHPTEIRATLEAARTWGRRVVAVFQPHLYSRTRDFAQEFAESLQTADEVVVAEIYPAREKPIPGVTAADIVDLIRAGSSATPARFVAEKNRIAEVLVQDLRPGDLVVVMGAGDIRLAAEMLLTRLGLAGLNANAPVVVEGTE